MSDIIGNKTDIALDRARRGSVTTYGADGQTYYGGPAYSTDLNAVHDLEIELLKTDTMRRVYGSFLGRYAKFLHLASASQKCAALMAVINFEE